MPAASPQGTHLHDEDKSVEAALGILREGAPVSGGSFVHESEQAALDVEKR